MVNALHTILIVDDQPGQRHELVELLRPYGYVVIGECSDGQDALEKVHSLRPTACIIDVTLRNTDALTLMARMRRYYPETTLFATAMPSQAQLAMEALTRGAVDILLRPFGRRTVVNILSRHLR
ncbi:MAG: response regulator [Armatimonadetes bacterium]|nr:response regulator [Armatimonadota bacterium]